MKYSSKNRSSENSSKKGPNNIIELLLFLIALNKYKKIV